MKVADIYRSHQISPIQLPLFLSKISAGFPNPADDYLERKLDLNEHLIDHPAATFFVRVKGESMQNAGIDDGDLLVVDRALNAKSGDIVVAVVSGEFTVKTFKKIGSKLFLSPENPHYSAMEIQEEDEFEIWGVVRHSIKSFGFNC